MWRELGPWLWHEIKPWIGLLIGVTAFSVAMKACQHHVLDRMIFTW